MSSDDLLLTIEGKVTVREKGMKFDKRSKNKTQGVCRQLTGDLLGQL